MKGSELRQKTLRHGNRKISKRKGAFEHALAVVSDVSSLLKVNKGRVEKGNLAIPRAKER